MVVRGVCELSVRWLKVMSLDKAGCKGRYGNLKFAFFYTRLNSCSCGHFCAEGQRIDATRVPALAGSVLRSLMGSVAFVQSRSCRAWRSGGAEFWTLEASSLTSVMVNLLSGVAVAPLAVL